MVMPSKSTARRYLYGTLRAMPRSTHRAVGHVPLVRVQDPQAEAGAAAGVDGIATRLEHGDAGGSGQVVSRRNGVARAVQGRAPGRGADLSHAGAAAARRGTGARGGGRMVGAPDPVEVPLPDGGGCGAGSGDGRCRHR